MNPPRCTPEDYTQFLLATPKACSATEAARVQPDRPPKPAHDAFTRLLHRLEPDPAALWAEVRPLVDRSAGVLVADDTTLDKPHAHHIQLVTRHWSGKHYRVVDGINLLTLVWTASAPPADSLARRGRAAGGPGRGGSSHPGTRSGRADTGSGW